jgi:Xaa-Pro aminopeptidase
VFPREGEPQLAVSMAVGPQFVHIATEISWIKDIVGSMSPEQDIIRKIKTLKLERGRLGIVGYHSGVFSASVYDTLRSGLPEASFKDATGALTEAMHEVSRTSEEELGFLKKVGELIDLSFEAVREACKPGVKECDLWATLESSLIKNGGWYGHFILATSGPNPTFLRAPASQNVLHKGDVVMFEIDPVYAGIMPQTAYSLSLGRPNTRVQKMFDICDSLYAFAIEELEKKRTFDDIEKDLVQRIQNAGYLPMTPQIHYFNLAVVMPAGSRPLPGDYFTIHPNICTTDYTAGAKFGDLVRVSQTGKVKSLLQVPAKLNII